MTGDGARFVVRLPAMFERTLKLILPVFIAASLGFTATGCDDKAEKKDDKKAEKKDDKAAGAKTDDKAAEGDKADEKADGGW